MDLDKILLELEKDAADTSAPKDAQNNGVSKPNDIVSVAQEVLAISQNFLASLQANQVAAPVVNEENQQQNVQQPANNAVVTLQIPASAILKTASITTEDDALAFFSAIGLLKKG